MARRGQVVDHDVIGVGCGTHAGMVSARCDRTMTRAWAANRPDRHADFTQAAHHPPRFHSQEDGTT